MCSIQGAYNFFTGCEEESEGSMMAGKLAALIFQL
jgi:hypothetical protein